MPRWMLGVSLLALAVGSCGGDSGAPTETTEQPGATTTSGQADPSSSGTSEEATTEEVRYQSNGFELVGDLVLPGGAGPHPAVIMVSGSGPQTRSGAPGYETVMRMFRDEGFAVLSWDKPGSGASTGEFESGHTLTERAGILVDAIELLGTHPTIDSNRIGLWGISQAGWVMPLAVERTEDIAFMIVVSGGGEDSIEQGAYQIGRQMVCEGLPPEEGELVEQYGPQAAKGTTYELYAEAMEVLLEIPGLDRYIGSEMASEEDWQPWPPHIDAYLDPMDIIQHTTIPVLAVFGELDKNIDPIQGAEAYEQALDAAGNDEYQVEVIPGVGHTLQEQTTGCAGDPAGALSDRYLELLDEWIALLAG